MVFDTDAHVQESPETFNSITLPEGFSHRGPQVVIGAERGYWMIDGQLFPKLSGPGVNSFATPHIAKGDGLNSPLKSRIESQELSDPKVRLEDMDKEGIDISIIFPTLFLAYPLAEDRIVAAALCRAYNNWIADKCSFTEGRIRWVATVPLPDVEAAVEEIKWAKARGACGVMTLGTAGDWNLDDDRLFPFYECAEKCSLPVCVHVGWSLPQLNRMYSSVYRSLIGPFVIPTFMAFVSFMAGGILDRFPKLKVGFFEAGVEWVPYWLDRLERFYRQPPAGSKKSDLPSRSPIEYIRSGRIYFSCELDEKRIGDVVEAIGDDCIVYASDLPHSHRVFDAVKLFHARTDIPSVTKRKILENGSRFFND